MQGSFAGQPLRQTLKIRDTGVRLKRHAKNGNHKTLPEIREFNALRDAKCFGFSSDVLGACEQVDISPCGGCIDAKVPLEERVRGVWLACYQR